MNFVTGTLHSLLQSWRKLIHDNVTDRPLLDDSELSRIHVHAKRHSLSQQNRFETAAMLQGDIQSAVYGNGFDFDGLRDYQPTDALRSVNWRAYARTQTLHVNIYKEERRPGIFVVMDRRTSMRFGTRHAIKAKIAAAIASYFVLSAISARRRVAGVCLNDITQWYPAKQGAHAAQHILNAIIAPCPPLPTHTDTFSFNTLLSQLPSYLAKGDDIIMVSDFQDIDESSATLLYNITRKHSLHAFHIIDPAEIHLPDRNAYIIQSMQNDTDITLDHSSSATRKKLDIRMQQHHALIQNVFLQSFSRYKQIITQHDLSELLADIA
jgi:uncharacterized protein (DUF58 family)